MENQKMNQEFKEEWCQALESDEFKQGDMALCKDGKYCCLGVASELLARKGILEREVEQSYVAYFGEGEDPSYTSLSNVASQYMGVSGNNPLIGEHSAIYLNDTLRLSFKEIAKLIREEL